MALKPTLCLDCGVNTTPCSGKRGCRHKGKWEWYQVYDRVWGEASMQVGIFMTGKDYLCIPCLEKRLGRELTRRDFTSAPVNEPCSWDSPRLAAAKAR